jgi:Ras-related protein Rab-1A
MNISQFNNTFKVIIIGDSGVGKSSILTMFCEKTIPDDYYNTTIGVDLFTKFININNKKIKLQIWDTAGQERFRSITRSYYRGANGIIITYDITNKNSFDKVREWISEIEKNNNLNPIIMLIGNKKDLDFKRAISYDVAKELADNLNIIYYEVSAMKNINIDECFNHLAQELYNDYEKKQKDIEKDIKKNKTCFFEIDLKEKKCCFK